ncbi:MAG: DUF4340 domain-containing protein [Clostridiaceae bacterium]|nr:DUF4340 domain-containing protein [Clostridiaceae bacterium]
MNHWKKLILPGILLAALVVGLVLVSVLGKDNGGTPTTTANPLTYVYYSPEAEVSTLTIENEHGEIVLERKETKDETGAVVQQWNVNSPANPAYAQANVSNLVSTVRAMASVRLIKDGDSDLALYGLDKPAGRATIRKTDGSEGTVLVGNRAGSGSNYYAMVEGTNQVHLIGTGVGESVLKPAMSMLDTTLCSAQYMDLLRVSIQRKTDQATIIANSKPFRDDAVQLVELQWKFDEPLHWMANTMPIEPVITEIIAVKAKQFVAMDVSDADLAEYGLDDPSYRFEVSDANQTYTITLGAKAGTTLYYGMSSRIPDAVFLTETKNFTLVEAPVMEWMNKFVYLANITEVAKVDLTFDNTKLNIEIDGKSEPNVFKINGKDADIKDSSGRSYFKSFYQTIIGATLEGVDREANPDLSKAIVKIEYTFRDGDPVKVAFVPRDAYSLYAFLDGEYTGGYVDIDLLDDTDFDVGNVLPSGLRTAYSGMVNAMDKAVDGVFN